MFILHEKPGLCNGFIVYKPEHFVNRSDTHQYYPTLSTQKQSWLFTAVRQQVSPALKQV